MVRILFLSGADSAFGQMAEALARQLLGARAEVIGAATELAPVDPHAIAAMAEIGIDIGSARGQPTPAFDAAAIDVLVTLGSDQAYPGLRAEARHLNWVIANPLADADMLGSEEILARFRLARDQIRARIAVLASLLALPEGPAAQEFHGSIRVNDLPASVRFYAWLLDTWPKEWTHRYATFIRPDLQLNFVLMVSDGLALHHDTLYHLGIGMADRQAVIDAYHRALAFGASIAKPPRTTWKGTPLHELWLQDPDGTLIEVYARLTRDELAQKPADEQPVFLVPGTEPAPAIG